MSKSPDFTSMDYGLDFSPASFEQWRAAVEQATGKSLEELVFSQRSLDGASVAWMERSLRSGIQVPLSDPGFRPLACIRATTAIVGKFCG